MSRFRVVMGHKVPTDHLIDVENVPSSFIKTLEIQAKQNWIHPDKPEYMLEYKANQWEDLQAMITKFNKDIRVPEPMCIVQTDDAERARILPPNIKDSDIPCIVLSIEPENVVPVESAKPSFVCPNCDFEGKAKIDIEAHLSEKHGEDPAVRSLAGKSVGDEREAEVPDEITCDIDGCEFKTAKAAKMRGHRMGAHRKKAVAKVA